MNIIINSNILVIAYLLFREIWRIAPGHKVLDLATLCQDPEETLGLVFPHQGGSFCSGPINRENAYNIYIYITYMYIYIYTCIYIYIYVIFIILYNII